MCNFSYDYSLCMVYTANGCQETVLLLHCLHYNDKQARHCGRTFLSNADLKQNGLPSVLHFAQLLWSFTKEEPMREKWRTDKRL